MKFILYRKAGIHVVSKSGSIIIYDIKGEKITETKVYATTMRYVLLTCTTK